MKENIFGLVVVAIVKNEVLYLQEWLDHYRLLGVEHFYIADNGSDDNSKELLSNQHDVTLKMWQPEINAQTTWYQNCIEQYSKAAKLMAFFDIDEFLVSDRQFDLVSSIKILSSKAHIGAMAINWRIFGSSKYTFRQPAPVTKRFIYASKSDRQVNKHVKCIVKPDFVSKMHVHAPILIDDKVIVDCTGKEVEFIDQDPRSGRTVKICDSGLRVNHYNIKSRNEFIDIKSKRGRANLGEKECRQLKYFYNHDLNDMLVTSEYYSFKKINSNYYRSSLNKCTSLPIFFSHIPKTAGTSFRLAISNKYSSSNILYDYGKDNSHTSGLVREYAYCRNDLSGLYDQLLESGAKFLSGHMPISKYLLAFGCRQTVSIVRDPIQRVISDYKHAVRHYSYKGSFTEFAKLPHMINRQSKFLSGVPLKALGFVGLNEYYKDSLKIFNHMFSLDVAELTENVETSVGRVHEIKEDVLKKVRDINSKDIEYYKLAKSIFYDRLFYYENELPYVHGDIQEFDNLKVRGWAWWETSNLPVEIDIYVNDEFYTRVIASDARPGLLAWQPPRKGYVGFSSSLSINNSDRVKCMVALTGQVIFEGGYRE